MSELLSDEIIEAVCNRVSARYVCAGEHGLKSIIAEELRAATRKTRGQEVADRVVSLSEDGLFLLQIEEKPRGAWEFPDVMTESSTHLFKKELASLIDAERASAAQESAAYIKELRDICVDAGSALNERLWSKLIGRIERALANEVK